MKKEKTYSMSDKKATTGGLSIGTVLFLIFLTLKLAEVGPVANWSWWWVTSPLWIPLALIGAIVAIVVGIALITSKISK
jgi:ABC-type antimicrobial peptide transport system permease subunit